MGGIGLRDGDAAKWVDGAIAGCDGAVSVTRDVVGGAATFSFAVAAPSLVLCYRFNGAAGWSRYDALTLTATAITSSPQPLRALVGAPVELTLSGLALAEGDTLGWRTAGGACNSSGTPTTLRDDLSATVIFDEAQQGDVELCIGFGDVPLQPVPDATAEVKVVRLPDGLLTAVGAPPLTVVFDGDVSDGDRASWVAADAECGTPDGSWADVRAGEAIFSFDGGAAPGGVALCYAAAGGTWPPMRLPSTLAVHAVTGPAVVEAVAGVPVNVTVDGIGVGGGAAADEAVWVRPGTPCADASPEDEVSSTAYIGANGVASMDLFGGGGGGRVPLLSLR